MKRVAVAWVFLAFAPLAAPGQESAEPESPWLLVPTLSMSPKLGFSAGAIVGYVHYFDEKSRPSIMGIMGQYTSTGSTVAGAFARTSFGEDYHRILALAAGGNIKNDYDDFLGTGVPLKSEDELRSVVGRYLYRVVGDWFIGGQAISTNYHIIGDTSMEDQALHLLGLQGFRSSGVGAAIYHDSRDNDNSPRHGWVLSANNVAYREALGGEEDFDVYRLDNRAFVPHGDGHVMAFRQFNQWTSDAPPSAFAPIQLRGYKFGQYLGESMSSLEVEERFRLGERWTSTVFAGYGFLYGNGQSVSDSSARFPSAGLGLQFVLKQKEGIVVNLEFAAGKSDNYGFYLKLGYAF